MNSDRLMKKRKVPYQLYDVGILSATDDELKSVSSTMGLSLSLEEMKTIVAYFKKEGRDPTDIELQSLGQAWSEHCCYKSSKPILKEFVFSINSPNILSRGDAGVMVFDDDYAYALRIESHNHPSAIEPYGGAATGIGGILRDVVCMGAQPIGLVDPLCFGPIDWKGELPPGIKHPRYLMSGIVSGIRDYGNRVGVPTISGGFFFDERYTGNCLVNVGCLGVVKRSELGVNHASGPGDVMILLGGRTGRDGIHGVTFASADLTSTSDKDSRGAVQLGDPITKEPTIHACLEVSQKKLITGMKDLGGGGLSCVVGEMALEAGGCGADIDLEKVPLKEDGLAPWEIWVSESQERMMVTCRPENVDKILRIFDMWDVLATPIGKTTDVAHTRLFWKGDMVFDMDLEFLTGGPIYHRPYKLPEHKAVKEVFPKLKGCNETMLALLSDFNVASKEWAIRQYDHEVRASTAIKPMVGKMNMTGPGDASVLLPVPGRLKGLAVSVGCNPWIADADPYKGGMAAVDEACRNIIAVGARPDAISDCLNFGNPEVPERLGELREAVRGLGEICHEIQLPIPSGNVSLYNEAPGGKVILPTPMILCCGLIDDVRKAVTADLKAEGDRIYIIGETKDEMGASLLYRKFGGVGGNVPGVEPKVLMMLRDELLASMGKGLVRSCHDCSDGGLAIAAAEMSISGDIGAELDLAAMGQLAVHRKLFSESNTRWLAEVSEKDAKAFEKIMGKDAVCIGRTGGSRFKVKDTKIDLTVAEMRKAWNDPIWKIMGGASE
jgi:phosphoribosylformylglycinamidine synthase II